MVYQLREIQEALDRRFKSRTAKCALLLGLYLLLHFSIRLHREFSALDEPMFYFTVCVLIWTLVQPWVDRMLGQAGSRSR